MNDLERDLHELLETKAGEQRLAPQAPKRVLRRARRRQARTGLIAGLTAFALVAVAFVGFRALLPLKRNGEPLGTGGGTTRTATVPYLAITYPREWVLTVRTPTEPTDTATATIQVTSFDPNVKASPVCFSDNQTMPADGVVLTIEVGNRVIPPGPDAPRWPQELAPNSFGTPELCGVKGEHLAASWASNDGSIPYTALVLIGPDASAQDRDRLMAAFHSLVPLASGHDLQASGTNVVLASGSFDGTPWTMFAQQDETQPGIALEAALGGTGGGLRGTGIGGVRVERPDDLWLSSPVMGGNTLMLGAVAPQVARVEVRPDGADPFDAEIVDLPPSMGATFRAFVAPMTGAPRGTVVAYDAAGAVVAEHAFSPDGYFSPKTQASPAPEGAIANGKAFGQEWQLVDTGTQIRLEDANGNELASAPREPNPALSMGIYTFVDGNGDTETLVFGAASPQTTEVVLFTSGLPGAAQIAPLGDGLQAYWQAYTPGDVEGQVIALDATCAVLQAINLATDKAPASTAPTSCGQS